MPLAKKLKDILARSFTPEGIHNIRYDLFRENRQDTDFSTTAIHGIDAVRFFAGSNYEYIRFYYKEMPGIGSGICNIYMNREFESCTTAQLAFCPVSGTLIERMALSAYNQTFFLNLPLRGSIDVAGRLLHISGGETLLDITNKDISDGDELFETNGFYTENQTFFDDIRAGKKPEGDISSGLQAVEIAECIRKRQDEYKA